jgi:hypothetical protein
LAPNGFLIKSREDPDTVGQVFGEMADEFLAVGQFQGAETVLQVGHEVAFVLDPAIPEFGEVIIIKLGIEVLRSAIPQLPKPVVAIVQEVAFVDEHSLVVVETSVPIPSIILPLAIEIALISVHDLPNAISHAVLHVSFVLSVREHPILLEMPVLKRRITRQHHLHDEDTIIILLCRLLVMAGLRSDFACGRRQQ